MVLANASDLGNAAQGVSSGSESADRLAKQAEVVEAMIEAAILAPSAENLQPWQFIREDDRLTILFDRTRRLPSDVGDMLSLTGIGAAMENAVLAASQHGWTAEARPSQDANDTLRQDVDAEVRANSGGARAGRPVDDTVAVAQVCLTGPGEVDPLSALLEARRTSRRMTTRPVCATVLQRLSDAARPFADVRLDWITEQAEFGPLAKLVGQSNRMRFEVKQFHSEFYGNLRVSRGEVRRTRDGLDLATLQLPWAAGQVLASLRQWPAIRCANAMGFSVQVGRQAASEMRSSGALGMLSVPSDGLPSLLSGGRALQRIWLAATRESLAFHPAAALPAFMRYSNADHDAPFSRRQRSAVQRIREQFGRLYPEFAGRTLQMVFRVGHGPVPAVRSLRRSVADVCPEVAVRPQPIS